jgi:hypothetical protein
MFYLNYIDLLDKNQRMVNIVINGWYSFHFAFFFFFNLLVIKGL